VRAGESADRTSFIQRAPLLACEIAAAEAGEADGEEEEGDEWDPEEAAPVGVGVGDVGDVPERWELVTRSGVDVMDPPHLRTPYETSRRFGFEARVLGQRKQG
jgi:hypothetical protein